MSLPRILRLGFSGLRTFFTKGRFSLKCPDLRTFSGESVHSGPSSIRLEAQILWNLLFDVPLDFIKARYFRDVDPRDYDA